MDARFPRPRACSRPRPLPRSLALQLASTLGMALLVQLGDAVPVAKAAPIHAAVQARLDAARPGENVSAIFVLVEQTDVPRVLETLRLRRATRADRHLTVVRALQETAARSRPAFLARAEALRTGRQVEGYTPYWISNLVVVSGVPEAIRELARHPDVAVVEPNLRPRLIEPVETRPADPEVRRVVGGVPDGLRAIRADRVWYELGINGEGTLVACLDTGVQAAHTALRGRWIGDQTSVTSGWFDVTGAHASPRPRDVHGHGTHVMGTICGLSTETADTIGVAWGAQWMAANGLSPQADSQDFDNDIVRAFQWFADPDGNPATVEDVPDVVQNSWGVSEGLEGYTTCDARWWAVIDNCEAAGVVVTFSAGNDGPGPVSMISPADRATTATNAFSVGAVNANGGIVSNFAIAGFSSRGPSDCPGEFRVKPEVVAPGVDVYSASPFAPSGYTFSSGTSMAGPHVAGVVALMRQVNPDLDPDAVKQILMATAQHNGPTDDNTYGWGMIDAYAAVIAAAEARGIGRVTGWITDATPERRPVREARLVFPGGGGEWSTDRYGRFGGFLPFGEYRVELSHPLLETIVLPALDIDAGAPGHIEAQLADRTGPRVAALHIGDALIDESDSVAVQVTLADYTGVSEANLVYRAPGESFTSVPMFEDVFGDYGAWIPHDGFGTEFDVYVSTKDPLGNILTDPEAGASGPHRIEVQKFVYFDDGETDRGWTLADPEDSREGRWLRGDPVGTRHRGEQVEPADDHSRRGTHCYFTGRPRELGASDVDAGCVTLVSPPIDLSGTREPVLTYWRWFVAAAYYDAEALFTAEISSDGGESWVEIESLESSQGSWHATQIALEDYIALSATTHLRFRACDLGEDTYVEAAIDDIEVRVSVPRADPDDDDPPVGVVPGFGAAPNPFRGATQIHFTLRVDDDVAVTIYDASGRRVRTLGELSYTAGDHAIDWDGRDDFGRALASGLYFYRFETQSERREGRVVLVR